MRPPSRRNLDGILRNSTISFSFLRRFVHAGDVLEGDPVFDSM